MINDREGNIFVASFFISFIVVFKLYCFGQHSSNMLSFFVYSKLEKMSYADFIFLFFIVMKNIEFPIRKVLYAFFVACFGSILVSFASVFAFSFLGFIILFGVYLFSIWKIDTKEYLYYYFIRTLRILFFFLPLASIFYSFSLTGTMIEGSESDLEAGATALGGAIGSIMMIGLCLIIGIVGGLIVGAFAKKPKEEGKNTGKTKAFLFICILILSIFYLTQQSDVEKEILGESNNSNTSEIKNTTNTENTNINEGKENSISDSEGEKKEQTEQKLSDLIGFTLTSYNFVSGDWSDYFEFSYDIENKSGKDILGYKGKFEILDMFGDSLESFSIDRIGDFKQGELLNEKGEYNYNKFISEQVKLAKAKFEDLQYKYTITDIIYKDNFDSNNKIFGKNTGKDISKVNYEIIAKKQVEGDFSNSVAFTLKITNNSEQNIKGIKGGFSIYNIFGEKLGSYELNYTDIIGVGESIEETMQYSINEFMTDDIEIYDTDFNLLRYNFEIEDVIYE